VGMASFGRPAGEHRTGHEGDRPPFIFEWLRMPLLTDNTRAQGGHLNLVKTRWKERKIFPL